MAIGDGIGGGGRRTAENGGSGRGALAEIGGNASGTGNG